MKVILFTAWQPNRKGFVKAVYKLNYAIFGAFVIAVGFLTLSVYRTEIPAPTVFYEYVGEWGNSGQGDGEFDTAADITVDADGNVLVSDLWNARVQYFTPTGSFLKKWEGVLNGRPVCPHKLSLASEGDLYIATADYGIAYVSPVGSVKGSWGLTPSDPMALRVVTGFGVACGGDVYVFDAGDSVKRFSPEGSFKGKWGAGGEGDGLFKGLGGLTAAPDGRVYVADTGNNRIQYFGADGKFLGKWGSFGEGYGQFDSPMAVAVGPDNNVYVADTLNGRFEVFSAEGAFVGACKLKPAPHSKYNYPQAIAVGPSGIVYVIGSENRIQYFRPAAPDDK